MNFTYMYHIPKREKNNWNTCMCYLSYLFSNHILTYMCIYFIIHVYRSSFHIFAIKYLYITSNQIILVNHMFCSKMTKIHVELRYLEHLYLELNWYIEVIYKARQHLKKKYFTLDIVNSDISRFLNSPIPVRENEV